VGGGGGWLAGVHPPASHSHGHCGLATVAPAAAFLDGCSRWFCTVFYLNCFFYRIFYIIKYRKYDRKQNCI